MFESKDRARQEVFKYIEAYYNHIRRHSGIGYLSPDDFKLKMSASTTCPVLSGSRTEAVYLLGHIPIRLNIRNSDVMSTPSQDISKSPNLTTFLGRTSLSFTSVGVITYMSWTTVTALSFVTRTGGRQATRRLDLTSECSTKTLDTSMILCAVIVSLTWTRGNCATVPLSLTRLFATYFLDTDMSSGAVAICFARAYGSCSAVSLDLAQELAADILNTGMSLSTVVARFARSCGDRSAASLLLASKFAAYPVYTCML